MGTSFSEPKSRPMNDKHKSSEQRGRPRLSTEIVLGTSERLAVVDVEDPS